MKLLIHAALVGCAWGAGDARVQAADPDLLGLQGKWTVDSFEYNGAPVELMKEAVREFNGDQYTLTPKSGEAISGVARIDSGKKPKEIDLEINERTLKGIYELDGDTLKMSYTLNGDERPKELVSKPDSGVVLVIHQRVK
jgi:uncharacterized protein (TIGR03067 family)